MKQFLKNIIISFVPIKLVSSKYNPIFLYHSLGSNSNFIENIDHVNLETLENQLRSVQKYWKFVTIDEYFAAKNKKGLACLTIDDGYKNVIDESLKIFENLEIPITVFINSATFQGKIFWRDKIRYIIQNKLVTKYIEKSQIFNDDHTEKFYSITKSPKFNSKIVENEIDSFLLEENIQINSSNNFCFDDKKYLIDHPLVSYGNHSANHYVMSSLDKNQQFEDILECKNFLKKFNINKSSIFCIPFGGKDSFNKDTISALEKLNYKAILLSENKLNYNKNGNQIDRFMPKKSNIMETIKTLYLKQII
tara:strand:- start:5112 stop:6032 length:921 start_codon:yes stop_codon:yes gene_type:complete